jgi:hypothetical protein
VCDDDDDDDGCCCCVTGVDVTLDADAALELEGFKMYQFSHGQNFFGIVVDCFKPPSIKKVACRLWIIFCPQTFRTQEQEFAL